MGWIRCVPCVKFWRDFVARTFALVWPVLHRVSSGNQTVSNAPKLYQTHENISLGSNGVDRVRWLRKIPMRLRGTNFCTSLAHFVLSFVSQPNCPKFTKIIQTHKKMSLGSNGVDRVNSLRKNWTRLRGTNFCINCTSSANFAPSLLS